MSVICFCDRSLNLPIAALSGDSGRWITARAFIAAAGAADDSHPMAVTSRVTKSDDQLRPQITRDR